MEQIRIADPEILASLESREEVQVLDPWGRVIGRFSFEKMSYPEFEMTDTELGHYRLDRSKKWYASEEVMTHLRTRLAQSNVRRKSDENGPDQER